MTTIYFDESGNTGSDLLNEDQPVFVLSSIVFDDSESSRICDKYLSTEAQELHFTSLKKYKKHHEGIIGLIRDKTFTAENTKIFFIHKRYMIVAKYLDLLVEPMLYRDGIDYLDGGMNIAHANLHFMVLPALCGKELAKAFYRSFVQMFRTRTADSVTRFYRSIERLIENCKDKDFVTELEILMLSQSDIMESLKEWPRNILDPIIPSFVSLCMCWNDELKEGYRILHDESKPLRRDKESLRILMNQEDTRIRIGYGMKTAELPLRASVFDFGDSSTVKQIQIADIFAGSYFLWLRGQCDAKYKDTLWNSINNGIRENNLVVDSISPTDKVGLFEDRKKMRGDVNANDYVTYLLMKNRRRDDG